MRVFEPEPGLAAAVFRGKYACVNPEGDVRRLPSEFAP